VVLVSGFGSDTSLSKPPFGFAISFKSGHSFERTIATKREKALEGIQAAFSPPSSSKKSEDIPGASYSYGAPKTARSYGRCNTR